MTLKEILRATYPVADATVTEIENLCEPIDVRKGEEIVRQGEVCRYLFFVLEGLFRVKFKNGHREETICFGIDGDPFTSVHSLMRDEAALYSFEAIENSKCLRLPLMTLRKLKEENTEILRWLEALLEEQIYAFERRYFHLGTADAYTRYKTFISLRAEIVNRIPLKYIAQYINVKPETLSRLRARYAKE